MTYKKIGTILVAITLMFASDVMASEPKVGDVYLCMPKEALPPVEAIVGKIEPASSHFLDTSEPSELVIVHLQLRGLADQDLPMVGHSPFDISAIDGCQLDRMNGFVEAGFEGGYQTWRDAFINDKAGVFSIDPAEAYWAMLGILDENGALKQ